MKKLFIFVVIVCGMIACKKTAPLERLGIIGKWKLTESLLDPGDGSGTWQPADPAHPGFLEFRQDGTLEFTPYNQYDANRYELLSDSTMKLFRGDSISFNYGYRLTAVLLTIHPPCYEACGLKYVPVE